MTPSELRQRRRALGLRQVYLARALGVSKQAIWLWEAGRRGLPPYLELALRELERQRRENYEARQSHASCRDDHCR